MHPVNLVEELALAQLLVQPIKDLSNEFSLLPKNAFGCNQIALSVPSSR